MMFQVRLPPVFRCSFDPKEWSFFLTGGDSSMDGEQADLTKPDVNWVTDDVWKSLGALEKSFGTYFQGLKTHVRKNLNAWSELATNCR
tara:strand:- start:614 stop:877 length:264 start_codon:yes stop_codon:yes gene_type:complete